MQESIAVSPHSLSLSDRATLNITGVMDVSGFDEENVNILTPMGNLIIKGEGLHITRLSLETGDVSLEGKINSLQYLGDTRPKGFVSRIFR